MTPEMVRRIQLKATRHLDGRRKIPLEDAIAMIWALNAAGLDMAIPSGRTDRGKTFSKKLTIIRRQLESVLPDKRKHR